MKNYLALFVLFLWGCANHTPVNNITIALTGSNHSLQISGFDKAIIDDIGRDSANEAWQALLPVYKMPVDTDMKDFQNAQPGQYKIRDSLVVFTPDTAFKQGQSYFLRSYQYGGVKNAWQYIQQKRRSGSLKYKDLLFRY